MARKSTITGDAIRDNTVTGADIDEGSLRFPIRDVGSATTLLNTDYIVRCINNSAMVLTLPAKGTSLGQVLIIKDALGGASVSNITIAGNGEDKVDNASGTLITSNFGCVTLVCDGINGWMVLSAVS